MEVKVNSYEGTCTKCGTKVPEYAGEAYTDGGRWRTRHKEGTCPAAATPTTSSAVTPEQLDAGIMRVVALMSEHMTQLVPELVSDNLAMLARTTEIKIGKAPTVKVGVAHRMLPTILTAIVNGGVPFLVGPAGSGKTTLAEQIAKAMKLKFYMAARVTDEFKLLGFINVHGDVNRTQFRDAYEHGGIFLFDEVDASEPDAVTTLNAALSNGYCDFPDGMVMRHKDFHAIAAGNTFGRGADRQYVGRNQLDAATLDRFDIFEVDYDEQFELEIAGNAEWTRYVQKVRAAVAEAKVRHVVSPRASIRGAKLLAGGMERSVVEEACVWKGLDATNRQRVESELRK